MTLPVPNASAPAVLPLGSFRVVAPRDGHAYLLSVPAAAPAAKEASFPAIVFLHGVADRGDDVRIVVRQGLPKLLTDAPTLTPDEAAVGRMVAERFIVVAPQCARDEVWDDARLLELLDRVQREQPVDAARIYLTGLSMGGFGAWSLGIRHAMRFAALVPICGGGRVRDIETAAAKSGEALQRLGIWAFHGAHDRIVPLEESQRMIDAAKRAGVADVRFSVYSDVEHDAWTRAYADPELYLWLLQHRRS